MTYNQIQYWNLQELIRSNKAREGENFRHNLATETETHRSNVVHENELIRHNKQTEAIAWGNLSELSRHNKATESETVRHNMVGELVDIGRLKENIRHNKFQDTLGYVNARETQRHNRQQEVFNYDKLFVETEAKRQANERNYYHGLTGHSYENITDTSFGMKSNKSKTAKGQLFSTGNMNGLIGGLTGIFMSAAGGAIASGIANTNDLFKGTYYYEAKESARNHQSNSLGTVSTYGGFMEGMQLANSQFN